MLGRSVDPSVIRSLLGIPTGAPKYSLGAPNVSFPAPQRLPHGVGVGSLSPQRRSIGRTIEDKTSQGLQAAGLNNHDATRWAGKLFGAFNDLTPLGNVTGADDGARMAYQGLTHGDLKTGLLGAGMFAASVLPYGGKAKQAIHAFHGSPNSALDLIRAAPPSRQYDNATSQFGAFFAPNEAGAVRYAGNNGKVYPAKLSLTNPHEMDWNEFSKFQAIEKGADGSRLAPEMWESRASELKQEAASLRDALAAKGHDGIVVRGPRGDIKEMASFNDVPLNFLGSLKNLMGDTSGAIRAWHGSPHDFDKFEWSPRTRGTGEGAQAYGDGLYFAENKAVAEDYRNVLGHRANAGTGPASAAAFWKRMHSMNGGDPADAIKTFQSIKDQNARILDRAARGLPLAEGAEAHARDEIMKADAAIAHLASGDEPKAAGRLYEVNINAEPEDFLDYDSAISRQSDPVRQAVSQRLQEFRDTKWAEARPDVPANPTGSWAYRAMHPMVGTDVVDWNRHLSEQANERLLRSGIPGIRYLDQGSRQAGGTSNYVVFDDKLIDILNKF